jgi:hypothetical protein
MERQRQKHISHYKAFNSNYEIHMKKLNDLKKIIISTYNNCILRKKELSNIKF